MNLILSMILLNHSKISLRELMKVKKGHQKHQKIIKTKIKINPKLMLDVAKLMIAKSNIFMKILHLKFYLILDCMRLPKLY